MHGIQNAKLHDLISWDLNKIEIKIIFEELNILDMYQPWIKISFDAISALKEMGPNWHSDSCREGGSSVVNLGG